jgi:hypothetical protein
MMEEVDDFFPAGDADVYDDTSKNAASERDRLKQNYYDSKYEYLKKKLEEK